MHMYMYIYIIYQYLSGSSPRDLPTPLLAPFLQGEILYLQPNGPNPLDHPNNLVDRPRAMGKSIPFFR